MSGKLILLGVVAGGAALLLLHGKANAASVPAGWNPPPGAVTVNMPANGPGTIGLKASSWAADAGQPAGKFLLIYDPQNTQSFVALFFPAATPTSPAVMATGSDTNSQLIMQTVPTIVASLQQSGAL
jgi:hypothetical protein